MFFGPILFLLLPRVTSLSRVRLNHFLTWTEPPLVCFEPSHQTWYGQTKPTTPSLTVRFVCAVGHLGLQFSIQKVLSSRWQFEANELFLVVKDNRIESKRRRKKNSSRLKRSPLAWVHWLFCSQVAFPCVHWEVVLFRMKQYHWNQCYIKITTHANQVVWFKSPISDTDHFREFDSNRADVKASRV